MERKELINEIINFYIKYGIIEKTGIEEAKLITDKELSNAVFVETLINAIILKTRHCKNTDIEKIKALLLELERIRLELEYNGG